MEYFKIETTLPELLEDYGSVHGRFIMVSLIQPFYSEAFIIVENCFDQLRMQIEKVMERYSEVSLRNIWWNCAPGGRCSAAADFLGRRPR